jgi:methionyl-tRNA synthetase
MALADKVNEYVDAHKPWEIAKRPEQAAALHDVCTTCIEAFRLLTLYLKPVLPELAARVEAFLQVAPLQWADAARDLGAHGIGTYTHLMQRVDPKLMDALLEPPPATATATAAAAPGGEALAAEIGIDDFARIDLRIARIVASKPAHGQGRGASATMERPTDRSAPCPILPPSPFACSASGTASIPP